MKSFIKNPLTHKHWDPSKGDHVNERIINEDKLYTKRKQRKKVLVALLTFTHLLFLILVFLFY